MGYNEVNIGCHVKSTAPDYRVWSFGRQIHPDGAGPLHVSQSDAGISLWALVYVAGEAFLDQQMGGTGVVAMKTAADAVSPGLRAWMDAVDAEPRCHVAGEPPPMDRIAVALVDWYKHSSGL